MNRQRPDRKLKGKSKKAQKNILEVNSDIGRLVRLLEGSRPTTQSIIDLEPRHIDAFGALYAHQMIGNSECVTHPTWDSYMRPLVFNQHRIDYINPEMRIEYNERLYGVCIFPTGIQIGKNQHARQHIISLIHKASGSYDGAICFASDPGVSKGLIERINDQVPVGFIRMMYNPKKIHERLLGISRPQKHDYTQEVWYIKAQKYAKG